MAAVHPVGSGTTTDLVDKITVRYFDGPAVLADLRPWAEVYEEVYRADLGLPDHADPPIGERLARNAGRAGFTLAAAYVGDKLVGYVYGYPLTEDTRWWEGLAPQPEPEFVREWPGRTVAMCEGLVRAPYRHGGLARFGIAAFLAGRSEERAAALVERSNTAMLRLCAHEGWQRVGELEPYPGWRRHIAFVLPLRGAVGR